MFEGFSAQLCKRGKCCKASSSADVQIRFDQQPALNQQSEVIPVFRKSFIFPPAPKYLIGFYPWTWPERNVLPYSSSTSCLKYFRIIFFQFPHRHYWHWPLVTDRSKLLSCRDGGRTRSRQVVCHSALCCLRCFFGFLFLFVFFFAEMEARQSHSKKFASILFVSFFAFLFVFPFLQRWRLGTAQQLVCHFVFVTFDVFFLFFSCSDGGWIRPQKVVCHSVFVSSLLLFFLSIFRIGIDFWSLTARLADKATKGTLPLSLTSWASDRKVLAQKRVWFGFFFKKRFLSLPAHR